MAVLVDTNILVYRFDNRFAKKRKIATDILRRGIVEDSVRLPHQSIIEFVAAVTRPIRGHVRGARRTNATDTPRIHGLLV